MDKTIYVQKPSFDYIRDGTKIYEIRRHRGFFLSCREGEHLIIKPHRNSNEYIIKKIFRILVYESLTDLFTDLKFIQCIPDCNSIHECFDHMKKYYPKTNGHYVAIHLCKVKI
jgi:ASC-1-like (ASCH) protein